MKNHIVDCMEVSCRVERINGSIHRAHYVGHFILSKKSIIFLSFLSVMDRLASRDLDKALVREAMHRPGSLHLPLSEITHVRCGETPEAGPEFTVVTANPTGKNMYTFRCAAFCGQESEDFEAVAYPYIAGQLRRRNSYGAAYASTGTDGAYSEFHVESPRSRFCRMLEVDENASPEEIRQAYRDLALVWHPDKHPDRLKDFTTRKMQELNTAYRSLVVQ